MTMLVVLVCVSTVLLTSVSNVFPQNSTNSTSQTNKIDLTALLGSVDAITLNGRIVTINGADFYLIDEKTFARLEKSVAELTKARTYISALEDEKKTAADLNALQEKLDKARENIDSLRRDVVAKLTEALRAAETAEAKERAAKELAIKDAERAKARLATQRKITFWAVISALVAGLVAAAK